MENKIIAASAGSGKTFQLTNRFIELVLQKIPVENILASTFTVKASSEILFKILKKAAQAAIDDETFHNLKEKKNYDNSPFIPSLANFANKEQLQPIVARLARELYKMRVGTLDSVFNKIATAFSLELNLPLGWTMLSEDDLERYILESVQVVLKNQKGKLNTVLADFYKGESKRSIVGDLITLAKEYLRIERETEEKHWNHDHLLRRQLSDAELLDQIQLLATAAVPRNKPTKDFPDGKEHERTKSAKVRIIKFALTGQWKDIIKHTLVQAVLMNTQYDSKDIEGDLRNVIETIGNHAFAVEIDKTVGETKAAYKLLKLIAEKYEDVVEKYRGLQFDDITQRLSNAAADEKSPLANIETLNHRLNAEAKHLLLDEFQDTSKPQWNVLRPFVLHADNRTNNNGSVFVVGDMKQAIFGWRGGVAEIFDTVRHDLGIDKPDEMPESQRSSPIIINVVNQLFQNICNNDVIQARDTKDKLKHPEYVDAATIWNKRFQLHLTAERNKKLSGYVSLVVCPQEVVEKITDTKGNDNVEDDDESGDDGDDFSNNDTFEAWHSFVAGQIQKLRNDKPNAQIGVLVGRNKEIGKLVAALKALEDEDGNPTPIEASQEGGVPLADSNAVQYVLSAMKLADHPNDTTAKYHLETSPIELSIADGKLILIGKEKSNAGYYPKLDINYRQSTALRKKIIKNGYGKTVKEFADVLTNYCDSREHERLQKLVELAYQFDKEQTGVRTQRFISRVEAVRVESPNAAKVRVMNYYAAKGLEFDIVVLPDLKEGLTKRHPNYVIARKTSPYGTTNSSAEPVEWVLKYVDQYMQKLLPDNYQQAFSDMIKNEMIEKLSVLYVAMTRPKQELLILLQPNKLNKSDKTANSKDSHSSTYSGIVCAGFEITSLKNIAGQTITLAGNENWYNDSESQKKKQPTITAEPETINCKLKTGKIHLIPTTPSSLEIQIFDLPQSKDTSTEHGKYTQAVFKFVKLNTAAQQRGAIAQGRSLPPIPAPVYRGKYHALRGTALHKCFESVKWLEEKPPREELLKLVEQELTCELNDLNAEEIINDFDEFCKRPIIAGLLSRSSYAGEVEVELERRFAVCDFEKGELLHGSIDRLVIQKTNNKITALEIYDYKSGNTNPKTYSPQLNAYKRAIKLLYKNITNIKTFLVYIEKDQDNIIPI